VPVKTHSFRVGSRMTCIRRGFGYAWQSIANPALFMLTGQNKECAAVLTTPEEVA
jgi:hypothetical protein